MSHAGTLAALFAQRARILSIAPAIENLAAQYAAVVEPLRVALNAFLAADSQNWPELLWAAGRMLDTIESPDEAGGYPDPDPPASYCTADSLARYLLGCMARAAARNDRPRFEQIRDLLATDPAVQAEAVRFPFVPVEHLYKRGLQAAQARTLPKIRGELQAAGLALSLLLIDDLHKVDCVLSPLAAAVLYHMIEHSAAPVGRCDLDGLLPPIGERPPLVAPAGEDCESEPADDAEGADERKGQEEKPRQNTGRPRGPAKPDVAKKDAKYYDDWQASNLSLPAFAKARGDTFEEAKERYDRERKRRDSGK